MPSRYGTAENDYVALLQAANISGLNQVICAGNIAMSNPTGPASFVLSYTHTRRLKVLIATVGSLKTIKRISFTGVLLVKAADIDNARLIAYPIVDAIRSTLDGHVVDYSTTEPNESVEPTATDSEDVVTLKAGAYGFMISWDFDMSFSKGIA